MQIHGHSIYGDQKYGKRGRGKQIALWAYKLKFIHPVTKEEMSFIDIPEKVRFVENIRRYKYKLNNPEERKLLDFNIFLKLV